MLDHSQIPPEVFATIFEIGILVWDIPFLPPLRLVCRAWNDIVITTPRLWGVITIHRDSNIKRLESQITRAKSSPLSIFVTTQLRRPHEKILRMLVDLAENWICADVPTSLLTRCRWTDLHGTLEMLRLTSRDELPKTFFDVTPTTLRGPPRLRSFIAAGLTKDWILPFLSPSITYLELRFPAERLLTDNRFDTLTYLPKAPQLSVLKLEEVRSAKNVLPLVLQRPVHLAKLVTLELNQVLDPSILLCDISASSLQTLTIRHPIRHIPVSYAWHYSHPQRPESLSPFFIQWSHGIYIPSHLHTLIHL